MSDLIDRQKAINVIERMRAYIGHNMERAVGAAFIEILDDVGKDIGRLPSAQPTFDARDTQYNLPIGTDCISRQAAIDALDKRFDSIPIEQTTEIMLLRKDLREMPPITPIQELLEVSANRDYWKAQCHSYEVTINRLTESTYPEPKRGRWTRDNACSECGYQPWFSGDIHNYSFCPNCGADMRGEQDG